MTAAAAINHKDPDNWLVGVGPAHTVYTRDAGKTWSASQPETTVTYFGDPVLISDGKGDIHYVYTAGPADSAGARPDRIVCRTSGDGGGSWTSETFLANQPLYDQVRPRPGMHKGSLYLTWTRFNRDLQKDSACESSVLFSTTSNDGKKWSDPVLINQTPGDCAEDALTMQGGAPVIGLDGKIFVAWSNRGTIYLDRSYDKGSTWLSNDLAIGKHQAGGSMKIPGFERGYGAPLLAVDNSLSFFRGTLYLVWADQSKGENDTDIWFMRSTNRGDFWSPPQRINKDSTTRHQFLPSMEIDETTGIIYIVYYDRRSYDDLRTDVYLSYSTDGGNQFTEIKLSESSFVPQAGLPFSGQTTVATFKGVILPAWTTMDDNGGTSVWTAPFKQGDLIKKEDAPRLQQLQQLQQQRRR